MKKLTIGIGIILCTLLIAASYKTRIKSLQRSVDSSGTVNESLNGILQADAARLVQNAVSKIDSNPANTQIWFSRQVVENVYNLLKNDSTGAIKPDGIRIYFSSIDPTNTSPLHYNNGIVVVSTYFSGLDAKVPDRPVKIHTDYFEHAQNADLFKLNLDSIRGIIRHDNDTSKGAMLYYTCNCDISSCITSSTHYIKRSTGEKMAQAFSGSSFNAKSEWFDIEMLGGLVAEMKKNNDDGIRIYFARGVYFAPGVANTGNPDDVGKAKFVIVTTQLFIDPATQDTIHRDYFGCDQAAMISISNVIIKKKGGNDNGELCPSNCDGLKLP